MSTPSKPGSQLSTLDLAAKKNQTKIVAVTAYDTLFARLVDPFVDIVLVGDSLGMVVQGNKDTLSVTLEQMIYHTRAVASSLTRAHLVADMPFLSYQVNEDEAVRNAGRLLSEGRAQSVKLEGGTSMAKTVERLVSVGIPVMGHIGLTPQSVHAMGGFKVQGKTTSARDSILQDALALEDAGAYSIVLEGIPAELAKEITERVKIPTIGIGAGIDCDGQVLVLPDLLGLNKEFKPKFVKHFANLAQATEEAVSEYAAEVREKKFPTKEHSFYVDP